ncbi:conserved hypothetical protein [[Clostridium] ultunense Esp]|uniref:Uncharacterized protein n=1 Tax=[Clostridium] ultunense Esp TaxID=1288971 RepID=M1ZFP4_9FIRM|nr:MULTISPECIES: hypothetical protein [Bacillota]MCF6463604.1 hypothetical protein [Clostridium sp. Cult1]CCQ97179.1 conserved hypothetical protein [[Clostridium] ultunense Esp]SHD75735.1 conserved protein of unknown function [[Clostridium] ultunense Esp]
MEKAINKIKILECPTGELEERIINILEKYKIANRNEVTVNRDESLDEDGFKAYRIEFLGNKIPSIVLLTKSGLDDYVVKVFRVYIN